MARTVFAKVALVGACLLLGACRSPVPSTAPTIPSRIGAYPLDVHVTAFHPQIDPYNALAATPGLPVVHIRFTVGGRPYGGFVCVAVAFHHAAAIGRTPALGYSATGSGPLDESIVVHLSPQDYHAGVTGVRVACGDEVRPTATTAATVG